jgi:hypothetical protein
MSVMYAVSVSCDAIPVAGDRPVVFHGINKSGSLAMARVLREAYFEASRANQFFSSYHAIPTHEKKLIDVLEHGSGHAFYVGHYLWGATQPPDAVWVTQVRHPLPRALSLHSWLKGKWITEHGDESGFPSLHDWILRAPGGRAHTQMGQLAGGFDENLKARRQSLSAREMREIASERLEREIAWFGIAELFEESIFAMAHLCGLPAVAPWRRDTRNRWRAPLADTEPETVALIEETYAEEIGFYEDAVALFRRRIASADFGPSFEGYKAACAAEYGERLVT